MGDPGMAPPQDPPFAVLMFWLYRTELVKGVPPWGSPAAKASFDSSRSSYFNELMVLSKAATLAIWPGLLLFSFVSPLATSARAQNFLLSGNVFGGSDPAFTGALTSLGLTPTYVSPFNYGNADLSGFSAVWLDGFSQFSPGTPGNPGLSAANLVSFMVAGGVVLVQNPGFGSEPLSAYPFGNELSASFTYPPGENTVRPIASAGPINLHLTSAGLSGWNPSSYGILSTIGSFTGVSDNGTANNWVTVVRPVGAGMLVYTEQGLAQRLLADPTDPQALQFVGNVVGLAAVPEPSATALVWSLGLGALLAVRRRSATA